MFRALMRRRGLVLVIVALLALLPLAGAFFFLSDRYPAWMRDFSDAAEAAARGEGGGYVCLRDFVPFGWQRLYVLPAGADPAAHPRLAELGWSADGLNEFSELMAVVESPAVVFTGDGRALWYTYLPQFKPSVIIDSTRLVFEGVPDDGLSPSTAVFGATRDGETVRLAPVDRPARLPCLTDSAAADR